MPRSRAATRAPGPVGLLGAHGVLRAARGQGCADGGLGQQVAYDGQPRPKNAGNSYEFDYAEWLLRQGVSGTGYVVFGKWEKLLSRHGLSLKQHVLVFRQRIVELFRSWHYEDGDFAVLSALTIGYKEALTDKFTNAVSPASKTLPIKSPSI